ncbi:hypothetical protein G9A89_003377 [Geosiphon pyriformis]|nr:hypothetical protein G9A89_003377 [Geosiphon pyriformis]
MKNNNSINKLPFYGRLLKVDECRHLTVRNAENNHEPSDNIAGHPTARGLKSKQKVLVSQMLSAGIAPKAILTALRQEDLEQHAISKTIYNEQAHLRKIDSINSDFNHISCN